MARVTVSETAVRELVREALGSAHLGDLALPEEPPMPVNVNAVVDPSACETDPINPTYVPDTKPELDVAIKRLTKDVPISKVPDIYRTLKDAIEADAEIDMENDEMNKAKQGGSDRVEEAVRRAVRKELNEITPRFDMSYSGTEYGDDDDDDDDDDLGDKKPKRAYKPGAIGNMDDVGGATFQDIAKELGLSVAGAKRAVDMALDKVTFVHTGIDDDEREILVLTAMNDYINKLSKTGELSPADVRLMKDHPEIVRELDGFREFLHLAFKKARKGGELENPLGEGLDPEDPMPGASDDERAEYDRWQAQAEPCPYCDSDNTEMMEPIPSMTGAGEDQGLTCLDCKKTSWSGPEMPPPLRNPHNGRRMGQSVAEGKCPACKGSEVILVGEAKDPGVACGTCKKTTWLREATGRTSRPFSLKESNVPGFTCPDCHYTRGEALGSKEVKCVNCKRVWSRRESVNDDLAARDSNRATRPMPNMPRWGYQPPRRPG